MSVTQSLSHFLTQILKVSQTLELELKIFQTIGIIIKVKTKDEKIKELKKYCFKKDAETQKLVRDNKNLESKLALLNQEVDRKNQNLKVLHGHFLEIDEDITRFKAEFSEKESKVGDLEEKMELRETLLTEKDLELKRGEKRLAELERELTVLREERKDVEKQRKELCGARRQVEEIMRMDQLRRINTRGRGGANLVEITTQTDQKEDYELIAKVSVEYSSHTYTRNQ